MCPCQDLLQPGLAWPVISVPPSRRYSAWQAGTGAEQGAEWCHGWAMQTKLEVGPCVGQDLEQHSRSQ